MYVCLCRAVTESSIRAMGRAGVVSKDDLILVISLDDEFAAATACATSTRWWSWPRKAQRKHREYPCCGARHEPLDSPLCKQSPA